MRPTDSHLGFLLTFGALPLLACSAGSDDDGAASSPTSLGTNSASNSADDSATGGDDGTGTATDPSAGTDPTQGTATDPTQGTATDPTGADDDTATSSQTTATDEGTGELPEACMGIPITPGCQAQSDKLAECYPRYARYYQDYAIYCACNVSYYLDMYGGPGCGQAQDDLYACIGGLSCEQLMGEDPYCIEESMAIDEICDFGSTSSGGIDDSADGG